MNYYVIQVKKTNTVGPNYVYGPMTLIDAEEWEAKRKEMYPDYDIFITIRRENYDVGRTQS